MSEPKMGPTQFKAEIERLRAIGKLPSLEQLLDAVAEARTFYKPRIAAVRSGLRIVPKRKGRKQ